MGLRPLPRALLDAGLSAAQRDQALREAEVQRLQECRQDASALVQERADRPEEVEREIRRGEGASPNQL